MTRTLEELEKEHKEAYDRMMKRIEEDPLYYPLILDDELILKNNTGYYVRRVFKGKRLLFSETFHAGIANNILDTPTPLRNFELWSLGLEPLKVNNHTRDRIYNRCNFIDSIKKIWRKLFC